MKAVKGVFFFAIIIITYYGLLRHYGDILSGGGWKPGGGALTDIVVYFVAVLHLWLLQRALIWSGEFVSPPKETP